MAVLHTPVTRQVTVGLPLYPSLQLPVQVAPTLLGVVQLNTPLDRVGGWPVHLTAAWWQQRHMTAGSIVYLPQ